MNDVLETPRHLLNLPTTFAEAAAEVAALEAELKRRRLLSHADLPAKFHTLLPPSRYKGAHGGRGGAKSHVFAELLIARCAKERTRAVCIREYQVSLEQSVKRLLEDKINAFGLSASFTVLNNSIKTPFGGIIIFQGMQSHTSDSLKSLEGYDIAWVEEAQSLSARSLELLRPTIRKEVCRHCKRLGPMIKLEGIPCLPGYEHLLDPSEIWFSWNPSSEKDPVDQLLRVSPPPDAVVVESSYLDNPYFPDVLRKEMEWDRGRDPEKYQHVWMGGYERHSEARVFKNWKIATTAEEFALLDAPPDDTLFNAGADWGYSVDPAVMVRNFVTGRTLCITHEVYKIGVEVDFLPAFFDGLLCGCQIQDDGSPQPQPCRAPHLHGAARPWPVTADSARPETISYLNRFGYPEMHAAIKGKDSVKEGVLFLQNFNILVHPRCIHTIDELVNYSYVTDKKTGQVYPVLEDKKNHVIDSLRYSVESLRAEEVDSSVTWGR